MSDGGKKCATCGKVASDEHYTCVHNWLGVGFLTKETQEEQRRKSLDVARRLNKK